KLFRLRLSRFRLLLQLLLLPRHLEHFLNRLIERVRQLGLPFVHLRLARLFHRVGRTVHLRRRVTGILFSVSTLTRLLLAALVAALVAVLLTTLRLLALRLA